MKDYIILLPPSEGKTKGGDETKIYRVVKNLRKYNNFNFLEIEREYIYNALRNSFGKLSRSELEKVFELKGDNLTKAIENLSDFLNLSTLKAINRYDGVMFKAIDYNSLSLAQRNKFDSSVIFIDGMFGLLKPSDLIPDYKLKITSKFLDVDVTKYWKERLVGPIKEQVRDKIVIDILPEAHRKVLTYPSSTEHYKITFAELKKGKLVNAGHNSKKLKGEFVRYIIDKDKISKSDLISFKHSEGYVYSENFSSGNEIVYVKN